MKKIPSPRGLPVVGTFLSIVASGGPSKLHLYVDKRHEQLGPIYREKIGPVPAVFISDGDYMRKIFALEGKYPRHIIPESWLLYNEMYNCKRGLLFMNGEEWFEHRKTINNILLKGEHNKFLGAASVAADNLLESIAKEGIVQNLERRLYKWSLEVILAALLGPNSYKRCKSHLAKMTNELSQNIHQIFIESASLSLIPVKIAAKLKIPAWNRFVTAANTAVDQGRRIVDELLTHEKESKGEGILTELLSTEIKESDLKRIVIDLILAAGDTTAHTMQWILHLISIDEHLQNKLHDELQHYEDREIHQCSLLRGCLKEALRLYPVAPFITRFMPEDVVLDGYKIKANELVLMSLYSSGRNPRYFPNADAFLPERWLRQDKGYAGVTNANASLPFAFGSRSCVGKKLAETQTLVALSKVLKNYRVTSPRQNRIDMVLHLITVPAEPVEIGLEPRP